MVDPAVALLVDEHVAHPHVLGMGLFKAVEVELGIVAHEGFYHLCGEETAVVGSMVAEEELDFRMVFYHNEYTAVDHQINVGAQDVDDLHGLIDHHALGHIDEQAVLGQHGVEGSDAIVFGLGQTGIMLGDELGMCGGRLPERSDHHAVGQQTAFGQGLVVEAVVDHEIERGAEVGHIALEGVVGVNGDIQTVEVQSVIGGKQGGDIRIFVSFNLLGGEAHALEIVEGLVAHGIHRLCTVGADDVAALAVKVDVLFFAVHNHPIIRYSELVIQS